MAEAAAPLQVMAEAAALSKVLAQVKCNIDELSPIECEAAYVAVASPSDLSKKGSVLILLDPGGKVKDSADAKSLKLCCCNSSIDPTGELSMGMGDIMNLVASEKGHTSVACAMPELARRCAAKGLIPEWDASRLGKVFQIYMKSVRWEKMKMSSVREPTSFSCPCLVALVCKPTFYANSALHSCRTTAHRWLPGMDGRGNGHASSLAPSSTRRRA